MCYIHWWCNWASDYHTSKWSVTTVHVQTLKVWKQDGDVYPPNTEHHICAGIMQFLRWSLISFVTDLSFVTTIWLSSEHHSTWRWRDCRVKDMAQKQNKPNWVRWNIFREMIKSTTILDCIHVTITNQCSYLHRRLGNTMSTCTIWACARLARCKQHA